jgi:hypothetical protein
MEHKSTCDRKGGCCLHQKPDESWPETLIVCQFQDGTRVYPLSSFVKRPHDFRLIWRTIIEVEAAPASDGRCTCPKPEKSWPESILITQNGDERCRMALSSFVRRPCAFRIAWPTIIGVVEAQVPGVNRKVRKPGKHGARKKPRPIR